ncbi:CAP domain-containing protein [Nicoliella spurrieriana]|uniref:CAP domain-containing protein n=1 Tax=Nicoliella spurrieriana TaxID=2925830 RepID=A0A976X689_9LACO|nr:CAP domain-containing protein [Nicoliella spurrieriana]UQS87329.1 CAP domain-containing protein [Nicoliella spurrieriana]
MKIKKYFISGITAATLLSTVPLAAHAKVTKTITYKARTSRVVKYNQLPTSSKVKGQKNFKLRGAFLAASFSSVRGIRYALLTNNGNKVGWFKLSNLDKVTTTTTTTKVRKKVATTSNNQTASQASSSSANNLGSAIASLSNATTSSSSASTNASSANTANNSSNYTTTFSSATSSSSVDASAANAATSIANMDYTNAATNNPSSDVLSAINQSTDNWNNSTVLAATAQAALNQVNSARATAGLPALIINDQLTKIAQMRAQQIATNFNHWDSNGQLIAFDDAQQLGLDIDSHSYSLSENLGKSFYTDGDTPSTVSAKIINAFQAEGPENNDGNEHGHYINDMDANNKEVGISVYTVSGTNDVYLAMEFGNYYK